MTKILPALLLLTFLLALGCGTQTSSEGTEFKENRFSDPVLQQIHDYQDHRYLDSLAPFFDDPNPAYRREAALAAASMQIPPSVPFLAELLKDSDPSVATAAAWALGQVGGKDAADALRLAIAFPDSAWNKDQGQFYGNVLQAIGKIGTELDLDYVIYQNAELSARNDVLPMAEAIYQFGLRGIYNRDAEEFASDLIIDGIDPAASEIAASYFARRKELEGIVLLEGILEDWEMIRNPVIRMNIARAMKHLEPAVGGRFLLKMALDTKEDYRSRINAILAYQPMPDSSAYKQLAPLLDDPNTTVAAVAAGKIRLDGALPAEVDIYLEKAQTSENLGLRGELFRAAAIAERKDGKAPRATKAILEAIEGVIAQPNQSEQYEKGLYYAALAEATENVPYLYDIVLQAENPLLKGYAMTGLLIAFGQESAPPAAERLNMLREALATRDAAVRSLVAYELRREDAGYTPDMDYAFLEEDLAQIKLPEGMEGYRDIQNTIQHLKGLKPKMKFADYNHPIDWSLVARISTDASATLETNKGPITFRLFVDETPATVATFVELVESGFYEGKFFHRVVPNFVIQTGCPRGDGYGSPPFSIRSEFQDLKYPTGAVGMASAGRDTESSQFFITHSPTPHLEGRYTVFGQVVEGMETVHDIQVGDKIERVTLQGVKAPPPSSN